MDQALEIVLTAAVTGIVSTISTVIALRVHIVWIRETLKRHEKAIQRAHERADDLAERIGEFCHK